MIRSFLVVLVLLLAGCAKQAPVHRYALRGEVVKVDAAAHTATIKHEKIDGWMEAMTMEFPVKDEKELAALRPGEHITATVFVSDAGVYWVGEIRQAPER
jgi:Cu/Ag efflux protein CusF